MKHLALSVGHGITEKDGVRKLDPGAVYDGLEEYAVCRDIAAMVQELCIGLVLVSRVPIGTLKEKTAFVNRLSLPVDLALEIHLNAFEKPEVQGTEVLFYPTSSRGHDAAVCLAKSISQVVGTRNRGAIPRGDLWFLMATTPVAVITESVFLSNPEVRENLRSGLLRQEIAYGHVRGIWEALKVIA